ncbi:MAG: hypothetical protein ACREE5_10410 [Acetobacteraceae bacterium]
MNWSFPRVAESLIRSGQAILSRQPAIPDEKRARAELGTEIVRAWTEIVPLADAECGTLAEGAAKWVLVPTVPPWNQQPDTRRVHP